MKIFFRVVWILTILLSIATGVFKILQQEADIELFKAIGFSTLMVTILGVLQVLGGILMIPRRTRKVGAVLMTATFIVASVAVFANGMMVFGFVSLLFILMSSSVLMMEKRYPMEK